MVVVSVSCSACGAGQSERIFYDGKPPLASIPVESVAVSTREPRASFSAMTFGRCLVFLRSISKLWRDGSSEITESVRKCIGERNGRGADIATRVNDETVLQRFGGTDSFVESAIHEFSRDLQIRVLGRMLKRYGGSATEIGHRSPAIDTA